MPAGFLPLADLAASGLLFDLLLWVGLSEEGLFLRVKAVSLCVGQGLVTAEQLLFAKLVPRWRTLVSSEKFLLAKVVLSFVQALRFLCRFGQALATLGHRESLVSTHELGIIEYISQICSRPLLAREGIAFRHPELLFCLSLAAKARRCTSISHSRTSVAHPLFYLALDLLA